MSPGSSWWSPKSRFSDLVVFWVPKYHLRFLCRFEMDSYNFWICFRSIRFLSIPLFWGVFQRKNPVTNLGHWATTHPISIVDGCLDVGWFARVGASESWIHSLLGGIDCPWSTISAKHMEKSNLENSVRNNNSIDLVRLRDLITP